MSGVPKVEYVFESESLPGVQLTVLGAFVEEGLTRPYRAQIELNVGDPDADLALLLGGNGVLMTKRGEFESRLCGVIAEVQETGSRARPRVGVVLVAGLALARHRRNTRMFQNKTVPEILEDVLGAALSVYGREAVLDLDASYDPREYCLQYQESDLDFCQRLIEEEGIAYAFDHAGAVEILRLTDANTSFAEVVTLQGSAEIPLIPHDLLISDTEAVHRFQIRMVETTTKLSIADFDWTQTPLPFDAEAGGEDPLGREREAYEHGEARSLQIGSYDQGVRRYQKNDAARIAPLRTEAANAEKRVGYGVGRVVGFRPGVRFTLTGHRSVGVDGDYLVTRVMHHSATVDRALGGEPRHGQEEYYNRFECIPYDTPYRPRRIVHKPTIFGIHTAIVTGPSGEEINVDEHGRINVQFSWDRENPADETSSCRIRVKQEWAGAGWGWWWVPRIGMEVVVHFIDGDPDRPLVTGAVYDGANPTPYALPDEKTKSTIKSNSSLGGGGFNELRFEDKKGEEEIFSHAQKDENEVVENDHNTLVHHDQQNEVVNDQAQTVDVNQVERVDANQQMTVGANRTVHVKSDYDETVDGTEIRTVSGDVTETFESNETRCIVGDVTESIGVDETRDISGNLDEAITAGHDLTVSGASTLDVTGSLTRDATGGINTTTPAAQTVTVAGNWTVTAAAGMNLTGAAGITLLIPGGVSRADNFWKYMMGDTAINGAIYTELFINKLDITILSTGCWGVKIEVCVNEEKKIGADMIIEGIKARKRDAIAKASGGLISVTEAARIVG